MKTIVIEIIKIIFPTILGFIFSWILNNRQKPNDHLEIAYNRIYYPLYRLIQNNKPDDNIDYSEIARIIEGKIKRYEKYFNPTTLRVYKQFKNAIEDDYNVKNIYILLKDNIYSQNTYLRRVLGYLTPNIFQIYYNSSKKDKLCFRFIIYIPILYVLIAFCSVLQYFFGKINIIALIVAVILIMIIDISRYWISRIWWFIIKKLK